MLYVKWPQAQERRTDAGERPLLGPGVDVGPEVEVGVGVGSTRSVGPLEPQRVDEGLRF